MNVTDVDDKIILRARKNHLLKVYEEKHRTLVPAVLDDIMEGLEDYKKEQGKKLAQLDAEVKGLEAHKKENKAKEKRAEKELLEKKLARMPADEATVAALRQRLEGEEAVAATEAFEGVAAAREVLAELLDRRHGHSVTDERIFRAHAAQFEEEFLGEMAQLGVRMPDVLTRVTDYVAEVIQFVERIESNGLAYRVNGSVYFNTEAFVKKGFAYGKLEPWSVGDGNLLTSGEGALTDKRDAKISENDFALWKQSKPGEPSWDSPWGRGRPGWHIECSAMASDLFGDNMDIHSGGSDLRFPHHDNELAQAEAHFGCKQWVNYFLHSGHLHIDGLKMSKSLKNFITIRQALETCSPRQMRLYFVSTSWWSVMDFDRTSGMTEIKNKEKSFLRFFENVQRIHLEGSNALSSVKQKWESDEKKLNAEFVKAQEAIHAAFLQNFDTPEVLKQLLDVIHLANVYTNQMRAKNEPPKAFILHKIAKYIAHILGVMGIEFPEHGFGVESASGSSLAGNKEILDALAAFRGDVRAAAKEQKPHVDFLKLTDRLRDEVMPELGIRLEDDGAHLWTAVPAEVLKKEIADKKLIAVQAAVKQKTTQKNNLERDLKRLEEASQDPQAWLQERGYSQFDEQGIPTHDPKGELLKKGPRSKLQKEIQKRKKDHAKYLEQLGKDPEFLEKLRQKIAEIDSFLDNH